MNLNQSAGVDKRYFAERFHSPIMAWAILGISIVLTLTAYVVSRQLVEERLHDKFDFRAQEIRLAIQDRLSIYEQTLWGGVALFYASPKQKVKRQQWAAFVAGLSLDEHWPGIQGMGYSIPLKPSEKNAHELAIRAEGFDDYAIKPEGERDEYSSIIYLEPFDWRNKRAFGYDMWSNAMRREAMMRARDEGVAATSGIITLVQETSEDVQRGFLTYVPVYRGGGIPDSIAQRREAFLGWVYAPFRAANLMKGILGSTDTDIIFDVYDGTELRSENLLYSSLTDSENDSHAPIFTESLSLTLQGRPWTIVYRTPKGFSLSDKSNLPRFVAITGFIIDILLFYVILSLHYINRRATDLAEDMTRELRIAKESLELEVEAKTKALRLARDGGEVTVRERTEKPECKLVELEKMNELSSG